MSGRRILALLLAMILVLSLCACGQSDDEDDDEGKKRGTLKTESNAKQNDDEEPTPDEDIEPTPTEEIIAIPTEELSDGIDDEQMEAYGYTKMFNVYLYLPENLTVSEENSNSVLLVNDDQTERLMITVDDCSNYGYTDDELVSEMQASIESQYGANYAQSVYTMDYSEIEEEGFYKGYMDWHIYDFQDGNNLTSDYDVCCFLFTDGTTVIYIESAYPVGEPTQTASEVISTLLMAEEY